MPLPRSRCILVLAVAATALASCSSMQVTTLWQNPATTQIRFTKVLALCIAKDRYLREAAEGELCHNMSRVACKPAAYAIPDSMLTNLEDAKALTQKEGYDGAVVVRVVDAHQRVTYMPPTYDPTFWGYYGYAWPIAYDPGSYRTDMVVVVETAIFSLARNQLLWVGTTEMINPQSLPDVVADLAKAVRGELLKRNLIPPS